MDELDQKLNKLDKILNKVSDGFVSSEDFIGIIEVILEQLILIKDDLGKQIKQIDQKSEQQIEINAEKINNKTLELVSALESKVNSLKLKHGKDGKTPSREELELLIKPLIPDVQDGKDGSPDTPEQIIDKINSLPEEEENQIDIKHIKGWKKTIEDLVKKASSTVFVGGGNGGRVVKLYDFSSQLDGVTKTFTLPAFWRIIDIQIGTIPPLRPTVDYTSNASAMTITFTSEIEASTYLARGLSAIVIYSE